MAKQDKSKNTNTAPVSGSGIDEIIAADAADKKGAAPAVNGEVVDEPPPSTALATVDPAQTGIVTSALASIMRVGDDGMADVDFDAAEKVGDKVTGGFSGLSWVPFHHPDRTDLNERALAEKLGKLPGGPGSGLTRQQISGNVLVSWAWGRRHYFLVVKVQRPGASPGIFDEHTVKMPEHWSIYSGLNLIAVGTAVAIRYDGRGKPKGEKQPPHLYSVIALEKGRTGKGPRKDSLTIESIDDKKKRLAKEKMREDERRAALDAADASDDGGEDVPF